ncbi:MAG: tRNA-dihydrouridine synthase family protein [Candidatus Lokiarchaeota archaeon]|nr:tRNA-dihydrouridine synthase family protein [Candidatus Lokiarchaeota archaeon]
MKLGTLNLSNNLLLAPLLNITTAPYRRFCRSFQNIGLVYVPMIYTQRVIKDQRKIEYDLALVEKEKPISIQLIGNEPEAFKSALDHLESYKHDIININAGCASLRSLRAKQGGYLIKDLELLQKIIDSVTKYSSRPVSLKTRLGYANIVNISKFSSIINNSNLDFITVHARKVKDRFDQKTLDLETLKKIKESVKIPVVGNGDINSPIDAKNLIDYAKVDAIMIGRASMGNPQIFSQIEDYLSKGILKPQINDILLMKKYLKIFEKIINDFVRDVTLKSSIDDYKFKELKRNSIWQTKYLPNSTIYRTKLSKTKSLQELRTILNQIFSGDLIKN